MRCFGSGPVRHVLTLVAVLFGVACGDSGESTKNGEPETTPPSATEPGSGAPVDKWADLYRDYFSKDGAASCSGSSCHGSASETGYLKSAGFLCPPNDAHACYEALTKANRRLLSPGDGKRFEETGLYAVLRKQSGGGMPKGSSYTFSENDLQRFSAWVASGAGEK